MSRGFSAIVLADLHPPRTPHLLRLTPRVIGTHSRYGQEGCSELRALQFPRVGIDGPARRRSG